MASEDMPDGWKWVKLEDIGSVVTGKTPSKRNPEDWGEYMLFITPSDYKTYKKMAYDSERKLSKTGVDRLLKKVLPPFSVMVTCIGSDMGKVAMNATPAITNQQINSIVPNSSVDANYLYYRLVDMYQLLRAYGRSGTAVPILNKGDFEKLEILLPPLPEQKATASVLSSLDDKIDLLHRQNRTLEAMAEALFRQWFIEEKEEGWELVKLGEYVKCTTGCSYKSIDLNPSRNALVTLKNFARDGSFRMDGFKEYTGNFKESQVVRQGDLVVAHTDITQEADIIGNPALVIDTGKYETLVITTDLMKVESNADWLSKEFLFYLFKSPDFKFHCLGSSNGTTVLHLSRKAIPSYEFKMPSKEKVIAFTRNVKPILEAKLKNIKQIRTLEKMRDTLLPKLMSGAIRLEHEEG